jgi:hypothetical protein
MSEPVVVKLDLAAPSGQVLYVVVDPTGQRASLVKVAIGTNAATGNISVLDVQDLTKRAP